MNGRGLRDCKSWRRSTDRAKFSIEIGNLVSKTIRFIPQDILRLRVRLLHLLPLFVVDSQTFLTDLPVVTGGIARQSLGQTRSFFRAPRLDRFVFALGGDANILKVIELMNRRPDNERNSTSHSGDQRVRRRIT